MQKTEKIIQGSYALSIAVLGYFIIEQVARYLELGSMQLFIYLGIVGCVLLTLGMFQFKKGLGFGLVITGMWCLVHGSFPFWWQMTDMFRFVLACAALLIVGFAMYRLHRQGK